MVTSDAEWNAILLLFEENVERISSLTPCEPMPAAQFCRESAHRTLGHLSACQTVWLPLLRQIRDGRATGSMSVTPHAMFRKLGYESLPWQTLWERFVSERAEWRQLLESADLDREVEVRGRSKGFSPRSMTRHMVEHERMHLDDLSSDA